MLALGRLLRLSLAPSAAADAAVGVLLGSSGWPSGGAPWLQIAGALGVYHGGMALNDWADRRHDGATRPERPIPSGQIPAGAALFLGLGLTLTGPLLAYLAVPLAGQVLGLVALVSLAYNLGLRGGFIGPLLLGTCRAANLSAGVFCGRGLSPDPTAGVALWLVFVAAGYGLYVFFLSCLARYEDSEAGPLPGAGSPFHPRKLLALAACVLALLPLLRALDASAPRAWIAAGCGLAVIGASGLLHRVRAIDDWNPSAILGAMGMGLRRLLVVTGSLALTQGGTIGVAVAACVLCGYPVSYALRRVFPPS